MADPPALPPDQGSTGKALGVAGRMGSTVVKLVTAFERLERVEAKLSATTEKLETRVRALEDRVLGLERDADNLVGRATAAARERGAEAAMQHLTALSDRVTRLEAGRENEAPKRRPRRVPKRSE